MKRERTNPLIVHPAVSRGLAGKDPAPRETLRVLVALRARRVVASRARQALMAARTVEVLVPAPAEQTLVEPQAGAAQRRQPRQVLAQGQAPLAPGLTLQWASGRVPAELEPQKPAV